MNFILSRAVSPRSPWPWIAVAALATIPHLQVIANPFMYDDWSIIPENPYMWHPQAWRKMFAGNVWDFVGRVGISNYYRPMMHVFNYTVFHGFGQHPGWFHFWCLLLHAGVSLMVMAVTRRISGSRAVGAVAGLLFAVHPVHTEVIAWIACSPELLGSLFSLLAIYLYLEATRDERLTPRRLLLALAMGLSLLMGQLSKEIGGLVPVIMVAYELLVRRKGPMAQLKERWLEYGMLSVATLGYIGLRVWALGGFAPFPRRTSLPLLEHIWTCLAIFFRYLVVLFWPFELNFYRYYKHNTSLLEPVVLAGVFSSVAVGVLGVWLYRRRAPEALAIPFYLLTLAPVFQIPYLFTELLMIERSAYLPSVAFCWLAAAGLVALAGRIGTRPVVAIVAITVLSWSARSALRMYDWHDEVGLFREGLAHAPDSFHIHAFYGKVLQRHNRHEEAVASFHEALKRKEEFADAHNALGWSYWVLGQPQYAYAHYRRAAEISSKEGDKASAARGWNNIGIVYRSQGQNADAIAAYRRAIALDTTFAVARNNLAYALLLEGQVEEAMAQLRAALGEDPTLVQAYANLGLAHAMRREWEPALRALAEAERLAPDNSEVHARIGEIHLARGEAEAARQRFLTALRISPKNERALAGLAALRQAAPGPPQFSP